MKKLSLLIIIAYVLVSCGPNEQQFQPVIKETSVSKAEIIEKTPTLTRTFLPSPTDSPTRTPTETSTIVPSSTFTPTENPTETSTNTPTARVTNTSVPIPTETKISLISSTPVVVIIGVNRDAEYVDIQNQGSVDVNLSEWNLVSEKGNQGCTLSGILKAGETLRIWAMTAEKPDYSCGYSKNIWNNSEPDPAVLYNPEGVEVSRD